ncbi:class I SAM-dependent methyltransferase [Streptomyces sp. NPDC002845]
MGLSMATAELWVERWERQQQRYAVGREERFAVIADVVDLVTAGSAARPLVLDLGCGPGSLAARLARQLPDADIVAVDMDPLLLELARTHHGTAARYVEAVIGEPGWIQALDLDRPLDAAVSTTALHYLAPDALSRTYEQLAALLRPGGVLVNGDHLAPENDSRTAEIADHIGLRWAQRQRVFAHEDWHAWWAAVADDAELADLLAARHHRPRNGTGGGNGPGLPLSAHVRLLRQAGFTDAGPVWQYGNSYVVVATR